jgi:hypothetical protein
MGQPVVVSPLRLLPLVAISAGLLVTACGDEAAIGGRACRAEDPPTAGNRVIWFLGDVQQGRDPDIQGGVDDPLGCAYDQLCEVQRDAVTEDDFRRSVGEAVSPLLTADSHAGPSVYVDRGLAEERPDLDTLEPELSATWVEVEATWYEHIDGDTIVSDSGREEHWRVDLVREGGSWRVCEFTQLET